MKVTVLSGQSLADIAIQVYGSMEAVFTLALENGISVTDDLEPGQILFFSDENMPDKGIARHYAVNKIFPATSFAAGMGVFDNSFDFTFE